MTERIPCVREGCDHMILPATAAKTGGYCMPCKQEMEREAHQRYIEANRRDVDLYEGVTDAAQILKIMHDPRAYNELIRYVPYKYTMEQVYLSLSAEQQHEMKNYAMDLIRSDDEDGGKDILLYLVCYQDMPLTAEIPELLERGIVYPAVLFKSASGKTRDHLIQQVNNDEENRNHFLIMLAYIGDEVVVQQFWEWKLSPPEWAGKLYVAPERYTLQAGWELTEEGQRRELFITPSYSLYEVGDNDGEGSHSADLKGSPIALLVPSSTHCPWCSNPFISLMNLHVKHPSLRSVHWNSPQLDVQTCLVCSSYSVVYMEMDAEGNPIWSKYNVKPDGFDEIDVEEMSVDVSGVSSSSLDVGSLAGEGEWSGGAQEQVQRRWFRIASEPRQPYHGSEWAMEPSISQVGGHPGWVQDADYPVCPACSATMKAIGQLDGEMIQENGEGVYYMFACEPCQMTAVSYQQS
ncbi:DUF1963 domain-containing protein [Paenibacillus polysaccharolyticus]|uniref:DUF1963 domain-containing protein n=1 Tax=Paenibacillus polysaccharolyticus TaxID=582692 RepID=UPI00203BBFB4|nr:DUF1963 domain-containing protein [Paenibacillus polysaccharolyticus]MCM3134023.1 DUF1963 domain-containing protein [Paenibacillus polysaccharolyticus]